MSELNSGDPSTDPYFLKGCLGMVALGLVSIFGAVGLLYAAQWLFDF